MSAEPRGQVQVRAVGASAADTVVWRMRGELRVSVIVKATFAFQPDAPMRVIAPEDIVRAEVHQANNPTRSVRLTSDLAPFLPAADVILTGHACAPEDETALGMSVRLAVYRESALLDKSINVLCATEDDCEVPFETMPLVYELAYGGIGFTDNPYGVGVASEPGKTPNLVDPSDPQKVACFAPVARGWPNRKRLLGKTDRRALEGPVCEIPDGFNFAYFQAAPRDQQIAYLQGNEWIVLEGMHAKHTQITSALPSAMGRARVFGLGEGGRALALTADTLRIDADSLTCSVVWRGSFPVREPEMLSRLVIPAGVDTAEKMLDWPPAPDSAAPSATAPVVTAHSRPSWDRTVEIGDPVDSRARPAVPFRKGPVNLPPPKSPPPEPRDLGDTFSTAEIIEQEDESPPTLPFTSEAYGRLDPNAESPALELPPSEPPKPAPPPLKRPAIEGLAERTLQLSEPDQKARPTIPFQDRFAALGEQLAALSPLANRAPVDPSAGLPFTGLPSSGSPISGLPTSGLPSSGLPISGLPTSGLPSSGLPISGLPSSELPTPGLPTSGLASSELPAAEEGSDGPSAMQASFEAARAKRTHSKDELVPIHHETPLATGTLPWGDSPSRCALAILAKATCDLVPDGPAALREEADPLSGERASAGPRGMNIVYPSDLVPFKVRADVTLVGHAQAPPGGASQVEVRFRFGSEDSGFDRSLLVFGERTWERVGPALRPSEPSVFLRMPLSYDHAFGGRGHATNPMGLGHDAAKTAPPPPAKAKQTTSKSLVAKKPALLPHLEDPTDRLRAPPQSPTPASFAPLPKTARPDKASRSLPEAFDWTRHQVAPPSQRLPFLRGDETFEITGIHPRTPTLKGALPGVAVRCQVTRVGGATEEIPMRLDTASFDLDDGTLSLVWRGALPVTSESEPDVASIRLITGPIDDDSPFP